MKCQVTTPSIVKGRLSKVFVGLSGGVDSSVSAALLKKQGYDVTGVFVRVWTNTSERLNLKSGERFNLFDSCQAADDRLDAMRVCAKLGIPFVELNLEKEYKKEVVDYMIREYRAGKTPNPDVFCNRFIKFGGFYKWARAHGADFIATGHYARIMEHKTWNMEQKKESSDASYYMLHTSLDSNKDQSYFLWQIRKEQLPHILFPVGGMKKPDVRKLAKKFGLPTAEKKDSQGLCFVGKVNMKEFLSHYITPKRGDILLAADERGLKRGLTRMKKVGEHDGAFFYTIGERFGFPTRSDLESGKRSDLVGMQPYYVIAKDMRKNTLTVSQRSPAGGLPLSTTEVTITDCNWLTPPAAGKIYHARVRYRQPLQRARIMKYEYGIQQKAGRAVQKSSIIHNSRFIIQFATAQTAAPGQSLVIYDGKVMLGGGIIE